MTRGSKGHRLESGSVTAHFGDFAIPICVVFVVCSIASANVGTYRTKFPVAENPIWESQKWINGQAQGIDWKDMQTVPGLAFGSQINSQSYDDSTAVLTGNWGPNQLVQAKVKIVKPCNATDYEEVELRTNSTISANSITGYEFDYRCGGGTQAYAVIVRWNGAFGDFTYLANNGVHGAKYEVHNGDVLTAISLRNDAGCPVLTLLKNGVILAGPVTDCSYPNGAPGMGMALGSFGGGGVASDFGFSNFMASDSFCALRSSSSPPPLTGDRPAAGIIPARGKIGTTMPAWLKTKETLARYFQSVLQTAGNAGSIPQTFVKTFSTLNDPDTPQSLTRRATGERSLVAFRRELLCQG
jgi:hypothetical protein